MNDENKLLKVKKDNYHIWLLAERIRYLLDSTLKTMTEEMLIELLEAKALDVKEAINVLLESNYDEVMLLKGSYPYYLKARISSDNGHLSNKDCALHTKKLIESGTTRIILGHLSQENNTPYTAENEVLSMLNGFERNKDYILEVAPVETTGKCLVF